MICSCGAKVDRDTYAQAISKEIEEGNTVIEASVLACPKCSDLDGDGHIFNLVVES